MTFKELEKRTSRGKAILSKKNKAEGIILLYFISNIAKLLSLNSTILFYFSAIYTLKELKYLSTGEQRKYRA